MSGVVLPLLFAFIVIQKLVRPETTDQHIKPNQVNKLSFMLANSLQCPLISLKEEKNDSSHCYR